MHKQIKFKILYNNAAHPIVRVGILLVHH